MFAGTSPVCLGSAATGSGTYFQVRASSDSVSSLLPGRTAASMPLCRAKPSSFSDPTAPLAARSAPGRGGQAEALAGAADGSLWLAGSGIYRVVRKHRELSLIPENPFAGPPPDAFIASNPSGGIWSCFARNLLHRDVGKCLPSGLCRALAFTRGGNVWAGYTDGFAVVPANARSAAAREFQPGRDVGNTTRATPSFPICAAGCGADPQTGSTLPMSPRLSKACGCT